jgi:hypothetical protein
VDFVIQQLPQDEGKELFKNLAAEFDKRAIWLFTLYLWMMPLHLFFSKVARLEHLL